MLLFGNLGRSFPTAAILYYGIAAVPLDTFDDRCRGGRPIADSDDFFQIAIETHRHPPGEA